MSKTPLEIFPCQGCPLPKEYLADTGAIAPIELENRLSELTYHAAQRHFHLCYEFGVKQGAENETQNLTEIKNRSRCNHPAHNGLGGLPGLCFLKNNQP